MTKRKLQWYPPAPEELTGDEYLEFLKTQTCGECGMKRTADGHDPCLGILPGVEFACCGHGIADGYVSFRGANRVLRGKFDHLNPRFRNR